MAGWVGWWSWWLWFSGGGGRRRRRASQQARAGAWHWRATFARTVARSPAQPRVTRARGGSGGGRHQWQHSARGASRIPAAAALARARGWGQRCRRCPRARRRWQGRSSTRSRRWRRSTVRSQTRAPKTRQPGPPAGPRAGTALSRGAASGSAPVPVSGGAPAPAAGQAAGAAMQEAGLHWERQVDLAPLRKLGTQVRPLRLATVCSGLNSPWHALRRMGVDAAEVASAELKERAWRFCQNNGLVGGCWFTGAVPLSSGAASFCRVHGESHCFAERGLDLLVAGFPCQPYSRKRRGSSDAANVAQHPSFMMSNVVEKITLLWRPALALLENVVGFDANRLGADPPPPPPPPRRRRCTRARCQHKFLCRYASPLPAVGVPRRRHTCAAQSLGRGVWHPRLHLPGGCPSVRRVGGVQRGLVRRARAGAARRGTALAA